MQINSFIIDCFEKPENFPIKMEDFDADEGSLRKARNYLATYVSDPWLRKDMIQHSSIRKSGGDLYLIIPHTGYAYCHNVTDAFLN